LTESATRIGTALKEAIVTFIQQVTTEGSPDFVPVAIQQHAGRSPVFLETPHKQRQEPNTCKIA